ncbi:uncharacterized protein ATC70_010080 [Mucor velutinosus]|uniref:Uncharacterized protein n=1 Tax=Mucor velutinosus TaxID=708070 RepID=A0AAN7DMS6_9FUNG|nr:hypothetical protein ATC70_010080 [Mucor velutinosus]
MTITQSVTPEQRTELKAIINDALKPYFESATPSFAWDSQGPQETSKMLVNPYGIAAKQQEAIRRAKAVPDLMVVRR